MKTHPLLSRRSPEDKVAGTFDRLFTGTAFELQLPNRPSRLLGPGEPAFQILVRNQAGVAALGSLNENRIGEAYLNGDIDLGGDVVAALDLRTELKNQRRLAHLFGRRRYETSDTSRNSLLVALITNGEGWHNNHHHYPTSARQGFFWWEIDLSYYLLYGLSTVGLVHDVRTPPQRILLGDPVARRTLPSRGMAR